jgi:hypothetical protein
VLIPGARHHDVYSGEPMTMVVDEASAFYEAALLP